VCSADSATMHLTLRSLSAAILRVPYYCALQHVVFVVTVYMQQLQQLDHPTVLLVSCRLSYTCIQQLFHMQFGRSNSIGQAAA
jgi:hypothetical protein